MHATRTPPVSRREILQALLPYATPDTARGVKAVVVDAVVHAAGLWLALADGPAWARALGALVAGAKMNALYTLGHDAGHGVLTASPRLNAWLALLCYLPALFNHRLWHHDHQSLHHAHTNGPHADVYRPMSLAAYRAAPWWRRLWERLVRSPNPIGFILYISYHSRLEKAKFFPRKGVHPDHVRKQAWPVTWLLLGCIAAGLAGIAAANAGNVRGMALDLLFGFAVPYAVLMSYVGLGAFLQHTHPQVPWLDDGEARCRGLEPVDLAVNLQLPRFMDYLTHNALAHPAHHMLPAIPFHRLREAQDRLVQLLGSRIVTTRPLHVPGTFRRCKLYDFEHHCWLDFSGRPTTAPIALPPGTGAARAERQSLGPASLVQ